MPETHDLPDADRSRPSAARSARERARAEIGNEIVEAARRSLATDGAAALSLRAIARELGMASSAVYRYVASRDELLTRLIVDAYDSLGAAAESREAEVDRDDIYGRFTAACQAVRTWGHVNPHEYALIYGSPVPGYVAPPDTVRSASRVPALLVAILIEAAAGDWESLGVTEDDMPPEARSALDPVRSYFTAAIPDHVVQLGLMIWLALFGTVSFELFGQLHNVVDEEPAARAAFFAECIRRWAREIGIAR